MKVVHVLKRIETIDQDIRELRKMEKGLNRDKSFSNAIYMSIEKQVNILLGERIKLLELKVENPPATLVEAIEGKPEDKEEKPSQDKSSRGNKKSGSKGQVKKPEIKSLDDIPMLTQDQIDAKISSIKITRESEKSRDHVKSKETEKAKPAEMKAPVRGKEDDQGIKILDTVLEHGTLNKDELDKKERKVKFFRENFPAE